MTDNRIQTADGSKPVFTDTPAADKGEIAYGEPGSERENATTSATPTTDPGAPAKPPLPTAKNPEPPDSGH
jgi:hypothetical protein